MAAAGLRLELFVDDVEATARFFESALGFVVPPDADFGGYVAIASGPVTIGLGKYADLPPGHPARADGVPRGAGVEIVIEVEDLDAAYVRACAHAARVEPLTLRPWGLRDFRVVTPDGFYVRVTTP